MTKKKAKKWKGLAKTEPMNLGTGPGVAALVIGELDTAIAHYQRAKDKRCAESPAEVASKRELRKLLHDHKEELHVNEDGNRFYRCDDRDYVLTETLKIVRAESAEPEKINVE